MPTWQAGCCFFQFGIYSTAIFFLSDTAPAESSGRGFSQSKCLEKHKAQTETNPSVAHLLSSWSSSEVSPIRTSPPAQPLPAPSLGWLHVSLLSWDITLKPAHSVLIPQCCDKHMVHPPGRHRSGPAPPAALTSPSFSRARRPSIRPLPQHGHPPSTHGPSTHLSVGGRGGEVTGCSEPPQCPLLLWGLRDAMHHQ